MTAPDDDLLTVFERRELKLAAIIGFYKREVAAAPEVCKTVVDIGCGKAGIDIALCAALQIEKVHLIDGTAEDIGPAQNRFSQQAPQPWRNVSAGVKRLAEFGFGDMTKAWPPDHTLSLPCDLIVSLLSWGHHYPVETYLGFARRSLRRGGRIVVDCRDRADSYEVLSRHFRPVARIGCSNKRTRWVFEKPMQTEAKQ